MTQHLPFPLLSLLLISSLLPSPLFAQTVLLPFDTPTQSHAPAKQEKSSDNVSQKPRAPQTKPTTNYQGVVPGKTDVVEHTQVKHVKTQASYELTWVGFQKLESKDRVFLQFAAVPQYSTQIEGNDLVITLPDTAPTTKNFIRVMDTTYFDSPVQQIETSYKRGITKVRIHFSTPPTPDIHTDNTYLFVDVSHA